mgnify:FL=1
MSTPTDGVFVPSGAIIIIPPFVNPDGWGVRIDFGEEKMNFMTKVLIDRMPPILYTFVAKFHKVYMSIYLSKMEGIYE